MFELDMEHLATMICALFTRPTLSRDNSGPFVNRGAILITFEARPSAGCQRTIREGSPNIERIPLQADCHAYEYVRAASRRFGNVVYFHEQPPNVSVTAWRDKATDSLNFRMLH